LLFGTKQGVVEIMRELLLKDARNLEIVIFDNTRLTPEWFADLKALPDVRFLIPRTRTINTIIDLKRGRRAMDNVEVIPTAEGDPLLPSALALPSDVGAVLLSHAAAKQLKAERGAAIKGVVSRTIEGKFQEAAVRLRVIGVIPERFFSRPAVFTGLGFLEGIEAFREGFGAAILGLPQGPPPPVRTDYASARLYARTLEAVAPLSDKLRADRIQVRNRAEDIARMQVTDRLLTRVLSLVALMAAIGGTLAFGGAMWIVIERKRFSIALLRLIGLSGNDVVVFVLWQVLVIAVMAFVTAYMVFLLGAEALNFYGRNEFLGLMGSGGSLASMCWLGLQDAAVAAILTVTLTSLASFLGTVHAKSIEPGECLREV
jgi:putative ABC transport system permease protein